MKNGIVTQQEKKLQVQTRPISPLQEAQGLRLYPPEPLLVLWHESGGAKGRAEGRSVDEYMSQSAVSELTRRGQARPIPAHPMVLQLTVRSLQYTISSTTPLPRELRYISFG